MIKAIWRAAAPGRLGMFIAVLAVVTLARLGGAVSQGDLWVGSESQATVAVIVLWLVLPVFVAMLATALLRGEHAPWSWGLARPVSRSRLLGAIVAIDAVTIGTCMFAAWFVLDGFGGTWGMLAGGFGSASPAVIAFAYVVFYMVCAVTGNRTSSTVRAVGAAAGVLWILFFSLTALATWFSDSAFGSFGLHERWARGYVIFELYSWSDPGALWEPRSWWLLSALLLATAAIGGPILAFVRSARFAPGPVRLGRLLSPTVGLGCLSAFMLIPGWTLAYFAAPPEARTGSATLRVSPGTLDPGLVVDSFRLVYDGGVVPRVRTGIPVEKVRRRTWTFVDLSAGHFEVCARVDVRVPLETGGHRSRSAEHCVPVVVTDEPVQEVSVDVTLDDVAPPS